MGYFANGSEGANYEHRYCRSCQNRPTDPEKGCAVWGLHMLYNYEQNKDDGLAAVLGFLIPRDGVRNRECRMYRPAAVTESSL
jgi:hypothetical protein